MEKIKLSPWLYNHYKSLRTPDSIMEKYFELDKAKPMEDYFETRVKTPWDGESNAER